VISDNRIPRFQNIKVLKFQGFNMPTSLYPLLISLIRSAHCLARWPHLWPLWLWASYWDLCLRRTVTPFWGYVLNRSVARRMKVSDSALTQQFGKMRRGEELNPATVGRLARALRCKVEEILAEPEAAAN
jgi:hypothetical protein